MYPLDQGLWGPTVRITHLRDELARLVRLDVVAGYRPARRVALTRYMASGRLRGLDGIYVESATTLPAEMDFGFLALARALRIPILTYIRDAYQLFPDYYVADTPRRWVSARLFRIAMRSLARVSTTVAVPSRGLARALLGSDAPAVTIPPGSPPPLAIPLGAGADQLLLVGNARDAVQGADRLIEAVQAARSGGSRWGLTLVCRPGEEPPGPLPEGVRLVRAEGKEIESLLPDVVATVIPRRRNAYNDFALPIKLFAYLAYGRPMLVTDCEETARLVHTAGCGLVVGDSVRDLADGIRQLEQLSEEERADLAAAGQAAARDASWGDRARAVLDALGLGEP
jgi:glycosyltransferase involved in cell wall biosynthesis